ncbi:MAG: VCBS repeat-containing protein [Deltaproteobacteria bacterium]|nr:VCBS repeat-containing protein [Deltaproteobacteria bacterium]
MFVVWLAAAPAGGACSDGTVKGLADGGAGDNDGTGGGGDSGGRPDGSTGDGGGTGGDEEFHCIYRPPVGTFNPALAWEWTGSGVLPEMNEVIALPVVMNMTDDNHDGVVDHKDIPDVAFISFSALTIDDQARGGVLRAVSGATGQDICTNKDVMLAYESGMAAYIDVSGVPTIIASKNQRVKATDGRGNTYLRLMPSKLAAFQIVEDASAPGQHLCAVKKNTDLSDWESAKEVNSGWGSPSIADLDGDGVPEIVIANVVFNETGSLKWEGTGGTGGMGTNIMTSHTGAVSIVGDLTGDGSPDVAAGNTLYDKAGKIVWQRTDLVDGLVAAADLSGDEKPELALVGYGSFLLLEGATGKTICGPEKIPGNGPAGNRGGAPMIADFDGDGKREIGVAGAQYLVVFDPDCKVKWQSEIRDFSSNVTGSSVFDFEGDGKSEAVYNDELRLRVFSGKDGEVLFEEANTTNTTFEYPIIADVNNDNKAEIVVIANTVCNPTYGTCSASPNHGIRVFTDNLNNWVSTRKIWNQHSYHVTNVCSGEPDGYCNEGENFYGRIPKVEKDNWSFPELNSYRQNVQGLSGFSAPDLVVTDVALLQNQCPDSLGFEITVRNVGESPVGTGIPVAVYHGDPEAGGEFIDVGYTILPMAPGGYATVEIWWLNTGVTWPVDIYVVVDDDGRGGQSYNECDEENNVFPKPNTWCKKEG